MPLPIVCAVNDEAILRDNLLRSPDIARGAATVIEERGHSAAGIAYNSGMSRVAGAEVVAFIHQDVYLPHGWTRQLRSCIDSLQSQGKRWGVLGIWGMSRLGQAVGRLWCNGAGAEYRGHLPCPQEVTSLDEVVLVLNMRSGIRFDDELPGFHLYGTDIVLQAARHGRSAHAIDAPVVHNTVTIHQLDEAYARAYRFVQNKWRRHLPLPTSVVTVGRTGWPLWKRQIRRAIAARRGRAHIRQRITNPSEIAVRFGYDSLDAPERSDCASRGLLASSL